MRWDAVYESQVERARVLTLSSCPRPELVLFHCTFIALKARNSLTVSMDPREYKFPNEKRLFQACVFPFQLLIP